MCIYANKVRKKTCHITDANYDEMPNYTPNYKYDSYAYYYVHIQIP